MEGVLIIKMKNNFLIFILFFYIFIFNYGFVNADIISFNSGGDKNLVINPDHYIEGFFSGIFQTSTPECGNGIIEGGEGCDDGNLLNGDGCSSVCLVEEGPEPPGPEEPEPEIPEFLNPILVNPMNINLNLATNTNREQLFYIKNNGNTTINITITQNNLDLMMIVPETFFTLQPGEVKEMRIIFVALSETGIFTGRIYIHGVVIPVTLNVKSKVLLFDSNIIVLNKDYLVRQGDKLRTSVTLIPMGDPERLDVTLNYVIKDYNGRVYLTRSETVLVENQVNFKRDFDTGFLPLGEYIVGLELIYPNGVAPSSAHFEVIQKGPTTLFGKIVFFLVNAILIILILLIFVIILRMWKQIRRNSLREAKYQEKSLKQGVVPKDKEKTPNKEIKKEEISNKENIPQPEGGNLKKQPDNKA